MTQERVINHSEYQRAVALLSQMVEFDSDVEKQINGYIQNCGICHFFENLEAFELPANTVIKLQAVRMVLFCLDEAGNKGERDGKVNNA